MAALPEALDDLSAPTGSSEGVSAPKLDASGDVKMGGVPEDSKAGAGAGGKKKKKGKK
jgi:hypothetical protein